MPTLYDMVLALFLRKFGKMIFKLHIPTYMGLHPIINVDFI